MEVPLADTSSSSANKPKLIFLISPLLPIPNSSFVSSAFSRLTSTFCLSLTKEVVGFGYRYILSGVNEFYGMDFIAQYHSITRLDLFDFIFSEIEFFTFSKAVFIGL